MKHVKVLLFMSVGSVFSGQTHQRPTFIFIHYVFGICFCGFFISSNNLLCDVMLASENGNDMSAAGLVSLSVRTRLRI